MDQEALLHEVPLDEYKADDSTLCWTLRNLPDWGFNVIAYSPFGMSVIGPKELYREYFKIEIMYYPVKVFSEGDDDKQLYMSEPPLIPSALVDEIETVYIPPAVRFNSSRVVLPNGISTLLHADVFHGQQYYGKGVTVAMVDSGIEEKHPYFQNHVNNINVIGYKPGQDNVGHGTGMAANLLDVAPDCDFNLFKIDPRPVNLPAKAAFDNAVNYHGVKVISNSWGLKPDPQIITLMDLSIKNAIQKGITVVFSCGNSGLPEFPGCHPDVISVGGVDPSGKVPMASNYASSGTNPSYPGRPCPDICGICGPAPRGVLIRMPTQKGSTMDDVYSNYDQTLRNDGWFVGSGTSAAAAQVAGGAALCLCKKAGLSPDVIKSILKDCATRINDAAGNPDPAHTGDGLIDLAKVFADHRLQ